MLLEVRVIYFLLSSLHGEIDRIISFGIFDVECSESTTTGVTYETKFGARHEVSSITRQMWRFNHST